MLYAQIFFIPAISPVLSLEKWSRDSEQELSQASFAFYNIRVHVRVRKGEVVAFFRCLRNPFQLHSQNIYIRKKHGKGIAETRGISFLQKKASIEYLRERTWHSLV